MTLQLTPAAEQRLEQLAEATKRSPSELLEEAIARYLEELDLQGRELQDAEAEANRDGWLSTDEVFARFNLRKSACGSSGPHGPPPT